MKAIYKHELATYFRGITAYIFGAFLLLFVGLGALVYNINAAVSNFEYALGFVSIAFVAIVPILTMKSFAEERKQKTDQLLYSLPIPMYEIVLGKYFALLTIFGVSILPVLFYPLIFKTYGDVYLPTSYGSIVAFFFMGAALLAMGLFISSLTDSQGLAAGICLATVLFNYFSVSLAEYVSTSTFASLMAIVVLLLLLALVVWLITKNGNIAYIFALAGVIIPGVIYFINADLFDGLVANIMKTLSVFERFYIFVDGIFDVSGLVYMASFAAFFVYLTVQSLEKRRYS